MEQVDRRIAAYNDKGVLEGVDYEHISAIDIKKSALESALNARRRAATPTRADHAARRRMSLTTNLPTRLCVPAPS